MSSPFTPLICRVRTLAIVIAILAGPATAVYAQAPKAPVPPPKGAAPAPAKPAVKAPTPAAAAAPAPKPAPAADVKFTSKYTTGDQVTESASYVKGQRERYEVADTVLLRQHDQKRTVQISRAANMYLVAPEGMPAAQASAPAAPTAGAKAPGVVVVATTIVDTGERKEMFGQQARHVKSMIDRQPQPGACDQTKQRIETDGWYIDAPKGMANLQETNDAAAAAMSCHDEINPTQNGDPKALGFPLSYKTTFLEQGGTPSVVSMEVTGFEITTLDSALFEIPPGMTAALNQHELAKAVSDANEKKLAAGGAVLGAGLGKKPGTVRIAVPDVTNKTTQEVDTRALRTRLISELTDAKYDAVPMAGGTQAELETRAKELGADYLLIAEVTDLKASKPGGIGRMMKATAGENTAKDITEAKLSVQLVPPGGKPRLTTNASGKDGGVGLKTGLGLAKVAGTMYLKMMSGGMYGSPLSALNAAHMMNMGGMGMLGDPSLMYGMGRMNTGIGLDRTAGAATFLMQQAMVGASAANDMSGKPSFDASLGDALDDAAKNVVDNLKKK
jgi:hypothetical protein